MFEPPPCRIRPHQVCSVHALWVLQMGQFIPVSGMGSMTEQSCIFPILNTSFQGDSILASVPLHFDAKTFHVWCSSHQVQPSRLIETAWGILLRQYTGCDQPSFSLMGHDAIRTTCVIDLSRDWDTVRLVKDGLEMKDSSLGSQRCNTAVNFDSASLPGMVRGLESFLVWPV